MSCAAMAQSSPSCRKIARVSSRADAVRETPRTRAPSRAKIRAAALSDLPALGAAILKGEVQGRVMVDVNA